MPTKARKIELLNAQIAAAKDGHPDDLAEWRLRTEVVLRRTVGEGSPALNAFRAISFGWASFGDPIDQPEVRQRDAMVRAIACLKSAVTELDLQEGMSNSGKIDVLNQLIAEAKDGYPDDHAEWRLRTETALRSTVGDGDLPLVNLRGINQRRITAGGEDPAAVQRDGVLEGVGYLNSALSGLELLDEEPLIQPAAEQSDGETVQRTFAELVTYLNERRRETTLKPPVLLLGAGASLDAGVGVMQNLYERFDCKNFEEFSAFIGPKSPTERYGLLAEVLSLPHPENTTGGYQALATLLAGNYFDLVLTTNMDPLLEDALSAAHLWRRDYTVMVNGVIRPERMELPLLEQDPRVKIVKLHGDLFSRVMAWTKDEMEIFLSESRDHLEDAVAGRDILVVGYSLRDREVLELVKSAGQSVWFTSRHEIPDIPQELKCFRAVIDPQCAFEKCFPALKDAFHVPEPTKPPDARERKPDSPGPVTASAQTVDDLMSATFGIEGPTGDVSSTAFLIAEPRVILCDRYATGLDVGDAATLVDSHGDSFIVNVVAADSNYPFGPTVLEAPRDLCAPGLRLASGPLQPNAAVQVFVTTGAATGISSGKVTARGVSTSIAPIRGEISDLVELECVVAPGASGAPVVDTTLSVCGFIVAGSTDPKDPRSYAYPAEHWASFVQKSGPRDPAK
jgi:hypothetical protein